MGTETYGVVGGGVSRHSRGRDVPRQAARRSRQRGHGQVAPLSGQWSRCVRATATVGGEAGAFKHATGVAETYRRPSSADHVPEQLSREEPAQGRVELLLLDGG
eukprot:6193577-Pleurochrysis_carterae.AAC.1